MKNKKGIEPVIATVLLIVITIAAVALIIAFVVPFVQKQLGTADVCFKANGIQLDPGATCYNTTDLTLKMVWNGNEDINLTKIRISVSDATTTKTKELSGDDIPNNPGEESTTTLNFITDLDFVAANINVTTVAIAPVLKPSKGNEITCDIRSIPVSKC